MAVTLGTPVEIIPRQRVGRHIETQYRIGMTSTYVTGGVPISASTVGLSQIHSLTAESSGTSIAPLGAQWDPANSKLILYETAGTVDLPFKELSSGATVANQFDITARGI